MRKKMNFKEKCFISYPEHIAKLAMVANKQTLFLAHMLSRMECHQEQKMLYVDLTSLAKRDILIAIGAKTKNPLSLASQYINKLQKAGLIKCIGKNRYAVDPQSFSYAKYVPKKLRDDAAKIYQTTVFDVCAMAVETWAEDEQGNRIDF
jgi:hypothetical protein